MYPDSPFAHPTGSFHTPQPIPANDPDKGKLVQVCFHPDWLPYILGSLEQLLLQTTWDAATPDDLRAAQMRANQLIYLFQLARPCNEPIQISGGAEGDENMIRQNPDNPCELQTSIDGTNWCTFADLSKCFPNTGQPGAGSSQPAPGGGCQQYQGFLYGNSRFLLPVVVNSGDTITLDSAIGATEDGLLGAWRCPDGTLFIADVCVDGTTVTSSLDPVPTFPHQAVIVVIDGTAYALPPGPFTVPGGVVNKQAYLQVNVADLSAIFGQMQIQVSVCNNQDVSFTHTFDFTLTTGAWTAQTGPGCSPDLAVWTPGVGWQTNHVICAGPNNYRVVNIERAFSARTLTKVTAYWSRTTGTISNSGDVNELFGGVGGGTAFNQTTNILVDPPAPWEWTGSTSVDLLAMAIYAGFLGGGSTDPGGQATISKIVVQGLGSDPF